jgi:transcriptional regulator with XRE-family HTH domain
MPYIERIKQLKKERGLSNQDLSTMTGIPASTVTKFLNGSTGEPPFSTYVKFAQALGFSLDDIAGITRPNETKAEALAENTVEAYTLLIAEKNARITDLENHLKEKDDIISELRDRNTRAHAHGRRFLIFASVLVFLIFLALFFDIVYGHLGYIRY